MNRREKELKTQGGRSIPERPILKKCCFKIPLQKVYWSNRNERWDPTPRVRHRPGPPVVPPPPRPIHGFANAKPEMVGPGAPFAKYFAGTVENFRSLITPIVLSLRPCPPFLSFSALFMIHTTIYNTQKKWISIRSQVGERRKTASVAEMALWLPSDFTSQINN
jgi:hypothetical protein